MDRSYRSLTCTGRLGYTFCVTFVATAGCGGSLGVEVAVEKEEPVAV